jgi:hypothetical protein
MTLKEHFKAGYTLFGPEAMQIADKFFGGEIDYETFMDSVGEPIFNYRIHRMMWDEIEKTNPKMIKMTSRFADYLDNQGVEFTDALDDLPEGGVIGQFDGIPIEIDDTIENEYYELVYKEN